MSMLPAWNPAGPFPYVPGPPPAPSPSYPYAYFPTNDYSLDPKHSHSSSMGNPSDAPSASSQHGAPPSPRTEQGYYPSQADEHDEVQEADEEYLEGHHSTSNKRLAAKHMVSAIPVLLILPLLTLGLVAFMFIIVGPVFLFYTDGASASGASTIPCSVATDGSIKSTCPSIRTSDPTIFLRVLVSKVTPLELTTTLSVRTTVSAGLLGSEPNSIALPSGVSLVIAVASTTNVYTDGSLLQSFDLDLHMDFVSDMSSYTFYPFDKYNVSVPTTAYFRTNTSRTAAPICVTAMGSLATFNIQETSSCGVYSTDQVSSTFSISPGKFTYAGVQFTFTRNVMTQFASIFLVILMWGLSASVLALAIDHTFIRPREAGPPTVGFVVGVIFSLSAVRNTQPDVPPIGAAVDVIGYFWNMAILCAAAIMILAVSVGYTGYGARRSFQYWSDT